ncbi:hypothetical protein F4805DRAFT_422866 [Annulohypoxylon moriforme]|nr:hypothetical protein F4805DRAFT_422866 [Annulohypoxylon moriforme]
MRDLIAYIREFQDAPSTNNEHEVLPEVVVVAVQHFYDSLKSLRELLPPDLSPSFAQKLRFVFNKKKIRRVTSQLESCKASTSLTLNIICSRNNIKLRDDLGNIRIDGETLAAELKTAARNCSQQTSQLLTEARDISRRQIQAFLALEKLDKQTLDLATRLQHTMAAQHNSRSRQQPSATNFTAADEDSIAKFVRISMRQTVEMINPEMNRYETTKVDDLSTDFASQAHHEGFFNEEEPLTQNQDQTRRSNLVKLFQKHETIWLKWVVINLCVTGFRHRQTGTQKSASYFSVEIEFIPRRFTSFGICLSYTNAPNQAGYCSICPTILTFNVVPNDKIGRINQILINDDVDALRFLIMNRELGLRDRYENGWWPPQVAIGCGSVKCIRYLAHEVQLAHSSTVFFQPDSVYPLSSYIYTVFAAIGLNLNPLSDIFECFSILNSEMLLDDDDTLAPPSPYNALWDFKKKHPIQRTAPIDESEIRISQMFRGSGTNIEPFSWLNEWAKDGMNISFHEFSMELCLQSGEDPNAPMKLHNENRPLEYAVSFSAKQPYDRGSLISSNLMPDEVSPRILTPLIKAGADIFYTREVDGQLKSIADSAYELGIGYLWEAALIECGYDPKEVKMEDKRRKTALEKLDSAERSGVDIEPMMDAFSTSGLRRRARARNTSDEMSMVD